MGFDKARLTSRLTKRVHGVPQSILGVIQIMPMRTLLDFLLTLVVIIK
jgi:hypothetical protein